MPSLDEYRARYDDLRSLSDSEAIQQIAKVNGVDVGDVTSYLNYEPPGGDFLRQLKNSWTQTKQLGAGLGAAAAATAETSFGEGGLATGLKKAAVEKYKEIGNELQINSKASDSLSYSWEEAHKGNFGALVDWTQGAFGMGIGQIGQAIGTAGVGGIIGRTVGKKVVEGALSEMVEKEAKRLVLNNVAEDAAKKQAVSNVASRIGQNAAIGAQVLGMEGGEIGGDLAARATEEGRILTGAEIARALAATVVAAGPEAITERWALDAMTGKLPWLKAMEEASGVKGKTARAGMIGAAGATIGAGQEFAQTYIEEAGKGNEINDQTLRMAIDAAGMGAVGGATPGVVGGLVTSPNEPAAQAPAEEAPPNRQVTLAELEQMRTQRLAQLDQEERGHEGGVVTNPEGGLDVIAPKMGRELSPQEKGERLFLTTRPPEAIARRYGLEIAKPADAEIAAPIIAAQDEDQAIVEFEKAATANVPAIESRKVDILGDAGREAEQALPGITVPDLAPVEAEQPAVPEPLAVEGVSAPQAQDVAAEDAPKTAMQIAFERAQQQSAARQPPADQAQATQPTASMDATVAAQQAVTAPQASIDVAPQALPEATQQAAPVEQRNPTRQERIAQMTPADIEQELYVSRATGIKNRRALDEDMQEGKKAVTFIDLDGLKYINDTFGHEKGNELLKKFADAMKAAGIDGYHVSGDEFAILSDDMVKAKKAIKTLETEASKVRIDSDTDSLKGITFSYGMSKDLATADANMQKMKASREQAGLRVRGGRPPNLVARLAPPSQPAPQQAPTTPAPRGRRLQPFTDNRLSDPEARLTLQAMADAAGWAEVGGRLTRDSEGNVGRTKWIPRADWFGDIQADKGSKLTGNLKGLATRVAVQKALSGEPMTEAQKRHVIAMLEWKSQEQLDYEAQNTGSIDPFTLLMAAEDVGIDHGESLSDEALAARALEIDEEAVMRAMAASEYESEFLDEMRRIVDGEAQRQGEDQAIGGGGESVPGAEAGAANQEGFSLTSQTEAQRVAEEARKKAEKKAKDEADAAAEERARVDREARNFELGAPTNQSDLQEQEIRQRADEAEAKARKEEAAEKPPEEDADDGRYSMVSSGEVLRSESGRVMSPVPRIDTSTAGKTNMSLKRLREWLLSEARQEATGSRHLTTILSGLDAKRLSQSDMDSLNAILFGDERGPKPRHRVTAPNNPAKQLSEPQQEYSNERDVAPLQNGKYPESGVRETNDAGSGQLSLFAAPTADKREAYADLYGTVIKARTVAHLKASSNSVKAPEDVAHLLASIRKNAQEALYAVVTDKRGKVLRVILHTRGLKTESSVSPLTLIAEVASIPEAARVHLGHNHPSGDPTPSRADIAITDKIRALMDGTGISFGHHVVVAGRTWSNVDAPNQPATMIEPLARTTSVPVTERAITKQGTVGERIADPNSAVRVTAGHKDAVFLLSAQNYPVGIVPLTADEMKTLRSGGRVNRLLSAINTTNASAAIIKTDDRSAALNVIKFLNRFDRNDLRVLDWIGPGGVSMASSGDSALNATGPFFSRGLETINVDGVDRPTTDSEGQRIHPTEEGLRNFWKWFSDSVVTDAQGRPLVVYHGSHSGAPKAFQHKDRQAGAGIFTDSQEVAQNYSRGMRPVGDKNAFVLGDEGEMSGEVVRAYLSIKKPITEETTLEDVFNGDEERAENFREDEFSYDPQPFTASMEGYADLWIMAHAYAQFPRFRKTLEDAEYDGWIYDDKESGGTTYIPFRPEQIKSAIGNTGEYSRSDARIHKAAGKGQQGGHTVASVTSAIEAKLGKGALAKIADHFMIVKDMAALKADMVKRGSKFVELVASKEDFLTKGLYDPSTDTSYIVAGNLKADDSPYGIFIHEVGEHYGLEKMLGPKAYRGVLNQAQMILRAGGKAMREAAVRVNASENVGLDPDAKNFHRLFADKMAGNKRLSREVIAYLADDPKNHDLPFMRRIMVAVREFMRKLGFTKPLTTDDIVSLITTAAHRSGEFATRGDQADALRSASAPEWYSQMSRVLATKLPARGSVTQMKQAVEAFQKKGEFKAEELEFSGLLPWLDAQKGTVTRDDILDVLAENAIEVREVVKGGQSEFGYVGNEWQQAINRAEAEGDLELAERINRAWEGIGEETENTEGQPKFADYQLPGEKTNYREVLLTLPVQYIPPKTAPLSPEERDRSAELSRKMLRDGPLPPAEAEEWQDLRTRERAHSDEIDALKRSGKNADPFRSRHFGELNLIAHVRLNDRIDAQGQRVLFVEEVQSDWHQKGRKEGYKGKADTAGWTAEEGSGDPASGPIWEVRDAAGRWILGVPRENGMTQADAIRRAADSSRGPDGNRVPDAPFKKSWPMLAMKRVLRMAVEGGYDAVAWPADAETVAAIEGWGDIERTGDRWVVGEDKKDVTPIINRYLQDIPREMAKYLKKWGGKVGETTIPVVPGMSESDIDQAARQEGNESVARVHAIEITDAIRDGVSLGQPLFAKKKFDEAGSLVGSKFTLPAETFAQKAQRYAQDEANRFQVVQDAVVKQGGTVDESSNIADAIKRYPGRLAAAMKDTTETLVEPFAKRIHDAGTTTDEVSLLAYAEHAPERNAEIAKINPRFPNDGTQGKSGSGMTDQEAADIIKQVKAMPNAAEMFRLSQELRDITDQNLDNLVAGGEMEQSQADEYRKRYKFYVPLKGFELVDESGMTQPTGKGLSTGSRLGFRAMGRESRAGQIFEHVIQDYENGLMLSEKAVVAKTLRNFIKANPDDALWTIDNAPKKPRLEKGGSLYQIIAGGNLIAETASKDYADRQVQALLPTDPTAYVAEVKPSPKGLVKWRDSPFDPEEEIRFIENGKPVRIQLSDSGMVRSYNRLWHAGVSDGLRLLNSYNGWLRQMYTQKNPAWFFMNAQKDVLSVMPYVTGEAGIKTALKVPGNIPGAFKAAWAFHHGKTAGAKWNALIEQFKATGGYTGFAFVGDIEAQTSRLNGAIARHTGWDEALGKFKGKGIRAGVSAVGAKVLNTRFFSWIEAMNSTFENMTRLAVFKSAIDSGMTPNEAGKLAKNASTNFNTRGEWGPNINAVWLFANAGIQGTRNVGHALAFSPHKEQVWALMGGLVALGMMAGLMSDDDDDLLDDQLRSRSLVFKVGDTQLSLPMPYGFGFFSGFGQLAAQAMKHPEKRDNIALKMATLAFDHYSPFGDPLSGEADLKNAVNVLPTSIKPVLNVAANVSPFGGGPLFPESPYDETKPDSTKMWAATRGTGYDKTAQWINTLTGGDQYKSGAISVSPETLKLSVSTLFGGVGKLASDLASLPFDVSSETLAPSKIPILKNYIREVDQKAYLGRFYDQAQEAQDAYTIWRRYLKAGMVDEATSYKQGEAAMISMGGLVSSYRKQIKMLRDMEFMIVNSDLSPTEKNIRLAKTNASIVQITSAFNDRLKSFH